ncbi:MAG: type IV pilus modification PilV family protein [Planctomycetota bacterium]
MRCFSKYIFSRFCHKAKGFGLAEILVSMIILSLICSSVFVVIDRCVNSTSDMTSRMQAFEVARENMEILLSRNSVKEKVDYGTSNKYPHINWETSVETFDEPVNSEMWVRAVCSAQYVDSNGDEQKVELTHWLTNISKRQMLDILKQMNKRKKMLKEQLIPTISEAAIYADVTPETIQMWLDNGMPTASNGAFIKDSLDLYIDSGGYPSLENIEKIEKLYTFMSQSTGEEITTMPTSNQQTNTGQGSQDQTSAQNNRGRTPSQERRELIPGYTEPELNQLSFAEFWQLLKNHANN